MHELFSEKDILPLVESSLKENELMSGEKFYAFERNQVDRYTIFILSQANNSFNFSPLLVQLCSSLHVNEIEKLEKNWSVWLTNDL